MTTLADELRKLRDLAEAKSATSAADSAAKQAHKQQEQVALDAFRRAGEESSRPRGLGYTFTAVEDKERGFVSDRKVYFRWAMEQEPSLEEFIETSNNVALSEDEFAERLYDALLNLTILKVTEKQQVLNQQVKAAHDDERPLPPGLDFEPVPYISVTKA